MKEFVGLRAKTSSYLVVNGSEDKKSKITSKCVIEKKLKLKDYKDCLKATQFLNKMNHIEKSKINAENHNL